MIPYYCLFHQILYNFCFAVMKAVIFEILLQLYYNFDST